MLRAYIDRSNYRKVINFPSLTLTPKLFSWNREKDFTTDIVMFPRLIHGILMMFLALSSRSCISALPLLGTSHISSYGVIRPHTLVRRGDFHLITIYMNSATGDVATANSPTGSGTATVGLFSAAASSESASNSTSSSSTSACGKSDLIDEQTGVLIPLYSFPRRLHV